MNELIVEHGGPRQHRQRLEGLLEESEGVVRIASAYVTDRDLLAGIGKRKVLLLTSLLPMDIASGATSIETLRVLIESGVECRYLSEGPRLHAKVYMLGSTSAVVTSANLTGSAFDSNIEVGVEVRGRAVQELTEWFDRFWARASLLELSQLAMLRSRSAALHRDYVKLKTNVKQYLTLPHQSSRSDELRDLLEHASQFFVCNTDRRDDRTVEEAMHDRGYATAWEDFKFPAHMERVQPGDAIFMFAKGVGIIGIGRATTGSETLGPNDPDRIRDFETPEWRIPAKWLAWRSDEVAYRYKAPNFTFWNATGAHYRDLREGVRNHFLSDSQEP